MPRVTPVEQLPYPCLTDPMQRQSIQDLATDIDLSLNRVRSDLDMVTNRVHAQIRRTSGVQTVTRDGGVTMLTYSVVDYQRPVGAADPAAGVIYADLTNAGVYYVEASANTPGYVDERQYALEFAIRIGAGVGATPVVRRKWATFVDGLLIRNNPIIGHVAGLALVSLPAPGQTIHFTAQVLASTNISVDISNARLAVHYLSRCGAPLNANPYFEQTIDPWSGSNATLALSTVNPYRGNSSMQVTQLAAFSEPVSELVPVTPGGTYHFRAAVRTTGNSTFDVAVNWYDAAEAYIATSAPPSPTALQPGFGWVPLFHSSTAPGNAAFGRMIVRDTDTTVTGPVYFVDDATFLRAC